LGEPNSKTPYFCFDVELHIEDDDGSLVDNGKQQEVTIDDDECFRLIWNMFVLIKRRLLKFNIWASWPNFWGQLAQLYGWNFSCSFIVIVIDLSCWYKWMIPIAKMSLPLLKVGSCCMSSTYRPPTGDGCDTIWGHDLSIPKTTMIWYKAESLHGPTKPTTLKLS
jgi:hypothetical protein